ncbi:hypothetical protein HYT23_05245 [Candidatus Pacearchaeota archaeon]|nr:hypothetical protein [Candidatus Pacearchaeota archaeon]
MDKNGQIAIFIVIAVMIIVVITLAFISLKAFKGEYKTDTKAGIDLEKGPIISEEIVTDNPKTVNLVVISNFVLKIAVSIAILAFAYWLIKKTSSKTKYRKI